MKPASKRPSVRKAHSSRWLLQIEQEIDQARDAVDRACLRAKRVCLLAQQGRFALARRELVDLHALAFAQPNQRLAAWLSFAEGMMRQYVDLAGSAYEMMNRAYNIARAAQLDDLFPLASAWMGQMAFARGDFQGVAAYVAQAIRVAAPDDHWARARAFSIVGLCYQFAARQAQAAPWYAKARAHASAMGDDASLSAWLYNWTVQSIHVARHNHLRGLSVIPNEYALLLGTDSATNFDSSAGVESLPSLIPVHRALLFCMQGDYGQALALYEEHLPAALTQGLAHCAANLFADVAWCRLNLGQREQALTHAQAAQDELGTCRDADDRAGAHSRLQQIYAAVGNAPRSEYHADQAIANWKTFNESQDRVAAALDTALKGLS